MKKNGPAITFCGKLLSQLYLWCHLQQVGNGKGFCHGASAKWAMARPCGRSPSEPDRIICWGKLVLFPMQGKFSRIGHTGIRNICPARDNSIGKSVFSDEMFIKISPFEIAVLGRVQQGSQWKPKRFLPNRTPQTQDPESVAASKEFCLRSTVLSAQMGVLWGLACHIQKEQPGSCNVWKFLPCLLKNIQTKRK